MVMEAPAPSPDDGHGVQSAGMMRTCMEYVSQFDRVVSAHCEIETLTTHGAINEGKASTRLKARSAGPRWRGAGDLPRHRAVPLTGCPLHIAHLHGQGP